MDISAQFYMPEKGMVNDKEMVFEFNGDDDVWVFIDDVLVLDLGGIHGAMGGTINFATGDITYKGVVARGEQDKRAKKIEEAFTNAGKEWDNSPYATHTLKFFYMERGDGQSNCMIRFNLPVIPEDTLEFEKIVDYSNLNNVSDIDFVFNAYINAEGTNNDADYKLYTGKYDVLDSKDRHTIASNLSATDGKIVLKDGQIAQLKDGITRQSKYYIVETGATSDKFNVTVDGVNVEQNEETIHGAKTDNLAVMDKAHIAFHNTVNVNNAFNLKVAKAGSVPEGATFNALVKVGEKVYSGKYDLYDANGQKVAGDHSTENGIIPLQSGQYALITGLIGGNEISVFEVDEQGNYFDTAGYENPAYSMTSEGNAINAGPDNITVGNKIVGIGATANEGNALGEQPTMVATITNALTPTTLPEDSIRVKKTLDGRAWQASDSFNFEITAVTQNAPLPKPATTTVSFEDLNVGSDTFSKIDGFGAIEYLKEGKYTYLVKEKAVEDSDLVCSKAEYRVTVTVEFKGGKLTAEVSKVELLKDDAGNTQDPAMEKPAGEPLAFVNSVQRGDLSISKAVKGTAANKDEHFNFKVSVAANSNAAGHEFTLDYGANPDTDVNHPTSVSFSPEGVATFKYEDSEGTTPTLPLKHGETVVIKDLPADTQVTVVETDVSEGTTVTAMVDNNAAEVTNSTPANKKFDATLGAVNVNVDGTTIAFTNTTDAKPNLGVSSNTLPAAGAAVAAAIGIAALAATSARRRSAPLGSHVRKE